MLRASRLGLLAALLMVAALVAGCGDSGDPPTKTVTVKEPPAKPRASTSRDTSPAAGGSGSSAFIHCDSNIEAKRGTTSCGFAQNVFWHYWKGNEASDLQVWSPATGSTIATTCTAGEAFVACTTDNNGVVRFPQSAVDNYSSAQADRYAGTHDLGPDPVVEPSGSAPSKGDQPDADPAPTPGENIPSYDEGRGYRVQCEDGMYSHSGGIQGACSGHGGVR